jgi:hypothetical protein
MNDQYKVGQKVKVRSSYRYYDDWKNDPLIIVGINCIRVPAGIHDPQYDIEEFDYTLITPHELEMGFGATDGFKHVDLELIEQ